MKPKIWKKKKTNFGRERHKSILKFLQPKYTNLAENRAGKFNKYKLVYYYPVWDRSIMEQLANNGLFTCKRWCNLWKMQKIPL